MSQGVLERSASELELRLARGAELLFEREQRGELDVEYQRWLAAWVELLEQYEQTRAA